MTDETESPLPPDRPVHLSASPSDLEGNQGRGRYLLLPGSRARAEAIAERFGQRRTNAHPRGHDLHMGTLSRGAQTLDLGVISTGMGCPSIDLIVTELLALGARTLLRVGTCGSLQSTVHTGDLVVATAAVRDEGTSDHYLPREFPALASFDLVLAASGIAARGSAPVHFGPVHTKDSLYARELELGPLAASHRAYQELLRRGGVLASEMECAHLFVLAQLGPKARGEQRAHASAVLAVIGDCDQPFRDHPKANEAVTASIDFALDLLFEFDARDPTRAGPV